MDTVFYAPIFGNRRIALASEHAFQYMTMASLLAWRATCRDTYLVATKELRQSLYALLAPFTPDPLAFLHYLTTWGAVIVGEAALAHILHDPSICQGTLELAVGNLVFDPFVHWLTALRPFDTKFPNPINKPVPSGFPFLRHITRISEFRLASGSMVIVYESPTPSACDVICGAWTTALMNFVTESSFGCAYPRLTLNHRGVLCDCRMDARRDLDNITYHHLQSSGFQFNRYSSTWPTYSTGPYSTTCPPIGGCGKTVYVCPLQGRYFGDAGSLVVFSHGFFTNLDRLRDSCVPPYGPMSTWRIPSKDICVEGCAQDESILPAFIITMLAQFVEDKSHSAIRSCRTHALPASRQSLPTPVPTRGRRHSI